MKLKNVAIGALLATSALAAGDDEDVFDELVGSGKDDKPAAAAAANDEPAKSSGIEHPQWAPYTGAKDAFFFEQFDEGAEERWKPSNAKKDEEFSYVGKWGFEEATVLPGFKGDRGLVVKSPAAHHAITHKFAKPLDNTDKTLVVQYEVKLQKGLECGGAYMKLLSENAALHAEEFNNDTPYQVMFGPDKCGSTNKVHFIIRRKNPKTGEYEEKHLGMPPTARLNKLSNLYTLAIHPDQTFEVRLNGETIRAGNMLIDGLFRPYFNPPEQIQDVNDVKPADWVDDEQIPDPEQAVKPEDWDEDAPFNIPDPEALKPADWLDDEPLEIEDPEAEKPEDWDDEEDGEYVAPLIPNPKCQAASGCGEWIPSLIRNPDYKGKWVQPQIPNPDYKGPWTPRLIPNPDYFEDTHPSNLEPIGGIGFELWTMQENILFNNIYVGHSIAEAEEIGNATFVPKLEIEKKEEEALAPPPTKKERKHYDSGLEFFQDDPVGFVTDVARSFIIGFSLDPKQAVIEQPLAAVAFGSIFLTVSALGFGLLSVLFYVLKSAFSSSSVPVATGKKAEKVAEKSEDKAKTSSSATGATAATKRKA